MVLIKISKKEKCRFNNKKKPFAIHGLLLEMEKKIRKNNKVTY